MANHRLLSYDSIHDPEVLMEAEEHFAEEQRPLEVSSPKSRTGDRYYQSHPSSASSGEENGEEDNPILLFPRISSRKRTIGRILLLVVSFLYGTLNVSLRGVYALPGPPSASTMSTARGWMAVLCFVPFFLSRKQQQSNSRWATAADSVVEQQQPEAAAARSLGQRQRPLWIVAVELAGWNFGAQALVNVGLLYISSARAAFFTQTSVVLTPVLSAIFGHHVHSQVWLACAVALGGLILLSETATDGDNNNDGNNDSNNDDVGGGGSFLFGIGDLLCLTGALCWSTYIFRLSHCEGYDEINMQAVKTFFLAIFYTIWFVVALINSESSLWPGYTNILAWILLFYSALGPGTVADVLQQKGQASVTASEANVILSMEPLFTAVLGRLLLGEATSLQEKLGGGLIILAALLASSSTYDS